MTVDPHVVNCGDCGLLLDEDTSALPETRSPCPACGSKKRAFHVSIHETITIRGKLGMKGRRAGEGKPFMEQVHGADLHRDTGTWRNISRVIDRENDVYHEVVKDPTTGKIIHECKEPLSEHRGHGAAKNKPAKIKGGEPAL